MSAHNLNISKDSIIMTFSIFVIISQAVIMWDAFAAIHLFFSILRFAVFFLISALFLKKPYLNRFCIWWLFFTICISFSTIVGSGNMFGVVSNFIDIATMLMLFCIYDSSEQRNKLLRIITCVLSFYIYLNLVLLILHPEGLWVNESGMAQYLLSGNYNQFGPRFILALISNLLCYNTSFSYKLNFWALIVVSLFSVLYTGSMTSAVGITLMLATWGVISKKNATPILFTFFIIYWVIQFSFVFTLSDLSGNQHIVYIVEDILNKDLTFTRRATIWEETAQMISNSPLIGYGIHNITWNELHISGSGPHNFIYMILMFGGYPLLIIFAVIIYLAVKNACIVPTNNMYRLLFGICVIFFMMIFEYYTFFIVALLLIIAYYYPYLHSNENNICIK